MPKLNNRGFSVVVVLVVVVVIAALGSGGYYVWHKNKTTGLPQKSSAQTKHANQQSSPNKNQTAQTDPTDGGKYLVITEWGVRIPITDALRNDAYYVIKQHVDINDSGSGSPIYGDVAYFSSHTLSNHPNNTCSPVVNAQGVITGAGPVAITRSDERNFPNNDNDRQINGKWYSVVKGNGGLCFTGSTGADEDVLITGIVQGEKQIQSIQ